MSKAVIFAAALAFAPLPAFCEGAPQDRAQESSAYTAEDSTRENNARRQLGDVLDQLSHSQLREELASGIDRIEDACAADIEEFCGGITPGEGRVALCMRANADQLSRRCRLTLFRVARQVRQTVSSIADECLNGLKAQCGNAQKSVNVRSRRALPSHPHAIRSLPL